MEINKKEYPRPQFFRDNWACLNGEWKFEFDYGNSGESRGMALADYEYTKRINVPFCPESKLSGINVQDFMNAVWYKRVINISKANLTGRILLHFGAVDYETTLWINEKKFSKHKGGFSSFEYDITDSVHIGENTIVVRAVDDTRSGKQPLGKQCDSYESYGCFYTRTTGIWQTVWLEFTSKNYIKSVKTTTDYKNGIVSFEPKIIGDCKNLTMKTTIKYKDEVVTQGVCIVSNAGASYSLEIINPKIWQPASPELYEVEYELLQKDQICDVVQSYFGFRSIELENGKIYLNGEIIFQRLVLDQGFYGDGIYTAQSDDEIKKDIEMSMSLGFNGARMHQKIFEERYLYWADRLGYLVWGEHASWGIDISSAKAALAFLPEWIETIERDYNHPSIVCWCPLNETFDYKGKRQNDDVISTIYLATKAIDTTRPVIDTSGHYHVMTDIYDIHDYEQDVNVFEERYGKITKSVVYNNYTDRQKYNGQPYFVSEYGGALWPAYDDKAWGYGDSPKTEEEFLQRYIRLTKALMGNENICGFCYTQLYDVEQEQNGLFTYGRNHKFSDSVYAGILKTNLMVAEIER